MSSSRSTTSALRLTALLRVLLAFAVLLFASPRVECGCGPTPSVATPAASCACEHEAGAACCCCEADAAPPDGSDEPGLAASKCDTGATRLARTHALNDPAACAHAHLALDIAARTESPDDVAVAGLFVAAAGALDVEPFSPLVTSNLRL